MQGIRHHKESFFHTRFWIVVLVILCILFGISVIKTSKKFIHAKSIRNEYRDELAQVTQHQADLQKNIDALSTERGKEAEIRDRYRVVKQGEQMILIIDNDKNGSADVPEDNPGFFKSIGNWFRALFHKS